METIIERLKSFISTTGLSPRAFALNCGIKQNTLSRQLTGANELSFATVLAVATQYPELSLEWLVRGDGNMFLTESNNIEVSPTNKKLSSMVLTLTEMLNEQEAQIEQLNEELKKYKNQ